MYIINNEILLLSAYFIFYNAIMEIIIELFYLVTCSLAIAGSPQDLLPGETFAVKKVVMDFEKALCSAVRCVFEVIIMSCVFHWTQAV